MESDNKHHSDDVNREQTLKTAVMARGKNVDEDIVEKDDE
jgi:hypothetical protein